MNNGALYRAAVVAEERITAKLQRLAKAKSDVAARGLAYDSESDDARGVYVSALGQLGVSPDELRGLTSFDLERVLRLMPAGGARSRRSTAMAFDAKQASKLDGILAGAPTPVDLSDR
jgi:hypothetical protein